MPTHDVSQLLACLDKCGGSEHDFLVRAQQNLTHKDYQYLEQTLEQGYAELVSFRPSPLAVDVYQHWCETFNKVQIFVHIGESVSISGPRVQAVLVPHKIGSVKALGWWLEGSSQITKWCPARVAEEIIQEALDVLGLPFERGLPPVKSRYERLMEDSEVCG